MVVQGRTLATAGSLAASGRRTHARDHGPRAPDGGVGSPDEARARIRYRAVPLARSPRLPLTTRHRISQAPSKMPPPPTPFHPTMGPLLRPPHGTPPGGLFIPTAPQTPSPATRRVGARGQRMSRETTEP